MERLADLFLARSEPNRWITVRIVVDPPVLVLSDSGGSDRFDWTRRPNGSVVLGLESLRILVRTGTSAGVLQIGACRGPSGTGDGTAVARFWRRGCVAYVATVRVA